MTTSWAYLADGQIVAACQANLAGVFLGVMSVVGGAVAARTAYTGRARSDQTLWRLAIGLMVSLGVAIILWLIRVEW